MCITCVQQGLDALKVHGSGYWPIPAQTNQQSAPPAPPAPPSQGQGSLPGFPPLKINPVTNGVLGGGLGPGQGPTPVTKTNSTGDPRIIWEDGFVAIIYAKDFPANAGMGRSKTRKDIADAIKATIDDQLVTAPGAGSAHDFVKVWLKELLARPLPVGPAPKVQARLPIDPSQFKPVSPKIASGGTYKGKIIPDFPHDCHSCGGKYYQGMFSSVHDTPDGRCPNDPEVKAAAPKRRR